MVRTPRSAITSGDMVDPSRSIRRCASDSGPAGSGGSVVGFQVLWYSSVIGPDPPRWRLVLHPGTARSRDEPPARLLKKKGIAGVFYVWSHYLRCFENTLLLVNP